MDKGSFFGKMEGAMLEATSRIKKKALENFPGKPFKFKMNRPNGNRYEG